MTKSDFRIKCLNQQRNLSIKSKRYRDGRVNHHLLTLLRHQKGKRILLYWPFGFEADIRKTIRILRAKNSLYLPFMDDVSFKMVPFRYPLERKSFGIYEPRNSNLKLKLIDIAIVPVVGVDGTGARIGFGKGMYDRFFPTLKSKPLIIFVQPSRCVTSLSLCDDYDVKGDVFITPDGVRSSKDFHVKHSSRKRWHSHTGRGNRIFNF
ncbi:MAG TPA: 5-formyltetrahydrofolate cyclo-ligase [Sulfuricurvum sp.]|nr:5-formyltetrahydrofolate cyclo-ligase [Sulfuricurvum sp.]